MKRSRMPYHPSQVDYVLVLLLLCLSGNQAFVTGTREEPLLILMFVVMVLRKVKLSRGIETRTFLVVILSYLVILSFQAISLPYISIMTLVGFMIKLIVGASVVSTVRFFRRAYVRVVVWLAVMSLIFHLPTVILAQAGIQVYQILRPIADLVAAQPPGDAVRVNILFHNFMNEFNMFRNSGMFWEPGVFSGYLLLALVLLATIQLDLPRKILKRWRAILIVTQLTTLSTTGFLFLPFALLLFPVLRMEERGDVISRILWVVLFLLLLVPASSLAWQLDFLGPKVMELFARAANQEAGWQLSRFGAILFDWTHIQKRPLFGWGQSNPEVYSLYPLLESYATGNGLTGYVRKMGLAGMLVFLLCLWHGLGRIGVSRWSRTILFSVVVFQLNGQHFLNYPLYLGLHFLGLERGPQRTRYSDRHRRAAMVGVRLESPEFLPGVTERSVQ